jgi:hypothetical protein
MWQDPFELPVNNDEGGDRDDVDPPSFDDGIQSETNEEEMEQVQDASDGSIEYSAAASRPVIHPAMINALSNKVGQGGAASSGINGFDASSSEGSSVMTTNPEQGGGSGLLDNSVPNLLLASPIQGENEAVLEEQQAQELVSGEKVEESAEGYIDATEEGTDINVPESMTAEFESIPAPSQQSSENESNVPDELNEPGGYEEEDKLLEGPVTGKGKEASSEEYEGDERVPPDGNLDEVLHSGPVESIGKEEQSADEGVLQDKFESNFTRESVIDLQIEATEELLPPEVHEEAEEDTQQLENEEEQVDFEHTTSEHESQGNDGDDPGDFKGFDEDFSSGHIDISQHESPPDATESQDTSNLQDNNGDYSGDGFIYHILQPKHGRSSSDSIPIIAVASLLGILLCFCCIRYKLRRYGRYIKPNKGKYSAIGSEDFFNGTFSDDISFNGKDSDDDMSFGSDDGDGIRIELGGVHELDANGGLTLEEING